MNAPPPHDAEPAPAPLPRGVGHFVGRGAEQERILAAARDAAAGRPWLVSVEGPGGAGKSALVRQCLEHVEPDFTVVRLHSDDLAADVPMGVVGQLVEAEGLPPFTAGILVVERLGELQKAGPVALVIEDLHWADEPSRQAIVTAIRRLDRDRVLVLVTVREEELPRDERWERLRLDSERCCRIVVPPLTWTDCAELAAASGIPLDRSAAERVVEHAGGNPLYVQAILSEVSPQQLTKVGGALPVPKSLASLVLAQVGACGPQLIALIEALAVLGGRSPVETLESVAHVERGLELLQRPAAASLVEVSDGAFATAGFAHPLYRAAVYDDLGTQRRRELHLAAADVLDGDEAMRHRVAAADPSDRSLRSDLHRAAEAARRAGSGSDAARYLLWESEVVSTTEERERCELEAVLLYLEAGQLGTAYALSPRVDAAAASPLRDLVAGLLAAQSGDTERAEHLLRAVANGPDPVASASALVQLGWLYTTQARGAEAVEVLAPVDGLIGTETPDAQIAAVLRAIGSSQVRGARHGLSELAARFPPGEARPEAIDALVVGSRGMLEMYAGRHHDAARSLRACIEAAQRGLQTFHLPRVEALLAQSLVALGQWDAAVLHSHTAVSLVEDEGHALVRAQAHASAAVVHAARGEQVEAIEHAALAREAADRAATVEADVWARLATSAAARAEDDHERVVQVLEPLERGRDDDGLPIFAAWWLPRLTGALIEVGRLDEATARIELLVRLQARRSVDLDAVVSLLRARVATLRSRRPSTEALALFELAISAVGPDTPVLDQAEIHWRHGRCLSAVGRRSDARLCFQQAEDLLGGLRGGPYLQAVQTDLAATGAEVRPAVDDIGIAVPLTERERDVIALVQQGYTNREVAETLFVSTKAVEYHMGNIFAKLGIRSRRELLRPPGA